MKWPEVVVVLAGAVEVVDEEVPDVEEVEVLEGVEVEVEVEAEVVGALTETVATVLSLTLFWSARRLGRMMANQTMTKMTPRMRSVRRVARRMKRGLLVSHIWPSFTERGTSGPSGRLGPSTIASQQ